MARRQVEEHCRQEDAPARGQGIGGADGAQEAQLTGALRDDHAERVHDDVRAHEQGDERERDGEDVDVVEDLVDLLRRLGGLGLARDRTPALGQERVDLLGEPVEVDALLGEHADGLELLLARQAERILRRHEAERGSLQRVALAEADGAHERELLRARVGGDGDGVAQRVAQGGSGVEVEDDLPVALRPAPVHEGREVELLHAGPVEQLAGRAAHACGRAVCGEHRAHDLHAARDGRDAVDRRDGLDVLGAEQALAGGEGVGGRLSELGIALDHDVLSAVDLGEELVEAAREAVGEREARRHERHAQRDGRRREHEALGVVLDRLECEAEHGVSAPSASCGREPSRPSGRASRRRSCRPRGTGCGSRTTRRSGRA